MSSVGTHQVVGRWPCHGASAGLLAESARRLRWNAATTFYQAIGGDAAMRRVADAFVASAASDTDLAGLFGPRAHQVELAGCGERLYRHLVGYWGGGGQQDGPPPRYRELKIDAVAGRAWLSHLRAAAAHADLDPPVRDMMTEHLSRLGFRFA
jgi:hemoglobin